MARKFQLFANATIDFNFRRDIRRDEAPSEIAAALTLAVPSRAIHRDTESVHEKVERMAQNHFQLLFRAPRATIG